MTRIEIPNDYPVELAAPDISPYAAGTDGVPYVWTFRAAESGPHAMIAAIVHGNEPCGALACDWLLRRETRPLRGTLTLAFLNVEAYARFDPADPNATRWVDEDLNRVWSRDRLDGDGQSVELRRAREVAPVVAVVDRLLDLHSMQHPSEPLALSGREEKGRRLAAEIGVPGLVVADRGHAAGTRMRDFGRFADPEEDAAAVLIECGQHWAASSALLARSAAARFLVALGMAPPDLVAEADPGAGEPPPQRVWEVTEAVTIETDGFRFARDFRGGEVLPKGALIGHDGPREIRAPHDDCLLVMPSMRLWPGQTAVRLARRAD